MSPKTEQKLVGWYLPREGAERTMLLCHGNAEDVAKTATRMGDQFRQSLEANVFVFDYRGFGKSEGKPFEQGVLEDSVAAMTWLNQKTQTKPQDVIVLGHSDWWWTGVLCCVESWGQAAGSSTNV